MDKYLNFHTGNSGITITHKKEHGGLNFSGSSSSGQGHYEATMEFYPTKEDIQKLITFLTVEFLNN